MIHIESQQDVQAAAPMGTEGMQIKEAKTFVNTRVNLTWTDRNGVESTSVVDVYEVNFVPFYGPCMITSAGEIRLDRILACEKDVRRIAV